MALREQMPTHQSECDKLASEKQGPENKAFYHVV